MDSKEQPEVAKGTFFESLKRGNNQIKQDRAQSIGEDAELIYQHFVQDKGMELTRLKRKRGNLLDMSPDNADSLMVANNFDASKFVKTDHDLGCNIRNLEIEYLLAQERFRELFGKEAN